MCTDDSACPGSADAGGPVPDGRVSRVPAPRRPRGVRQRGRGAAGRPGGRRLPELPGRPRPGRRRAAGRRWSRSARSSLAGWRAAQNRLLRRFDAESAHDADGYATTAAWLAGRTGLGRKDAKATVRQMRLLGRHPLLDDAAADGTVTISWAREMAGWTGKIGDQDLQQDADQILLEAAQAGADLDGLRVIAQAAYEAWRAAHPDDDPPGKGFEDRFAQLDTTMDGAGRLTGDLTPECAAAVRAVLEALGKKRGPEDDRTAGQRYHDALQEGCELLIRAKMVPDRAGSDTRVDVSIPLSALRADARRPRRRGGLAAGPGRPARLPAKARTPRPPPATPSSSPSSPAPPTGTSSPR